MKNFMLPVLILLSLLIVSCGGGGGSEDNTVHDTSCLWFSASDYGRELIPIFGDGTEDHLHIQATSGYYFDIYVEGMIADPDGWKTNPYCEAKANSWGFRFEVYKVDGSGWKYYDENYYPDIRVQIGGQLYDCQIVDDSAGIHLISGVFLIPIQYNGIMNILDPFESHFAEVEEIFVDNTAVNMTSRNY